MCLWFESPLRHELSSLGFGASRTERDTCFGNILGSDGEEAPPVRA
jgi:hypothetical protein